MGIKNNSVELPSVTTAHLRSVGHKRARSPDKYPVTNLVMSRDLALELIEKLVIALKDSNEPERVNIPLVYSSVWLDAPNSAKIKTVD